MSYISPENVHRAFAILEVDNGFVVIQSYRSPLHGERIAKVSAHVEPGTIFDQLVSYFKESDYNYEPPAEQ